MVSAADFGYCFSRRWLGSPEFELHHFPLVTPYPADLFTIVSMGQCLHLAWCFIGCLMNSSFLPIARVMSWLVFGIFGASCASYPQYHPTPSHSFDLLDWKI